MKRRGTKPRKLWVLGADDKKAFTRHFQYSTVKNSKGKWNGKATDNGRHRRLEAAWIVEASLSSYRGTTTPSNVCCHCTYSAYKLVDHNTLLSQEGGAYIVRMSSSGQLVLLTSVVPVCEALNVRIWDTRLGQIILLANVVWTHKIRQHDTMYLVGGRFACAPYLQTDRKFIRHHELMDLISAG